MMLHAWPRLTALPIWTLAVLLALAQPASGRIFADGFGIAPAGGGVLPSCYTDRDPLNLPLGFIGREVSWEAAFFGNHFPEVDAGGLSPVGSFTFADHDNRIKGAGIPMTGTWLSIPFDATGAYKVKWFRSQAVLSRGYRVNVPADAVYVTVSPCAGDFRLPVSGATDERSPTCRRFAADGNIFFGVGSLCPIAGQGYINIIYADPYDGLQPLETTCAADNAPYCNANFGD